MIVKVISSYRDKFTKKIHQPGEELNITKERADEILKVGKFIEFLEEPKKQGKSADDEEPKKPADDEEPKQQGKSSDDEKSKKPADGKEPKAKGKKKNNKSNEENAG